MTGKPTLYTNVVFRNQRGRLRLTEQKVFFKPYDWDSDGRYISWRWTAVRKQKINEKKVLLKLVSKRDISKCAIFQMQNRIQLDNIRLDVADRLDYAKNSAIFRDSGTGIGKGLFFGGRRNSEVSFQTFASTSTSDTINTAPNDSSNIQPNILRCDTDKTSNQRTVRATLLLDPRTDASPSIHKVAVTPVSAKLLKSPAKVCVLELPSSMLIRLVAAIALGVVLALSFHKAANLAVLTRVAANASPHDSCVPNILPKQPLPGLNLSQIRFIFQENTSSHKEVEDQIDVASQPFFVSYESSMIE